VPDARSWRVLLGWTVAFAAVAAVLASTNRALFDATTHHLLAAARLVDNTDGDLGRLWSEVPPGGLVMALACSLSGLVDLAYPYALAPVLAASLLAALALVTWRVAIERGAGRRGALLLVAATSALLLTSYDFAFHAFSLRPELASACFIVGFVGLVVLASERGDAGHLPSALACLAAFALSTPSGGLAAVPYAAVALCTLRLPRAEVAPPFAVFVVALPWVLAGLPHDPDPPWRVTLALLSTLFVGWLVVSARPGSDRWRRRAIVTATLAVAVGCAVVAVRAPGALAAPDAALPWIGLGLLALCAAWIPRRASSGWFLVALLAEAAVALELGTSPARRFGLHALVLVVLLVGLRYAAVLGPAAAPRERSIARQPILEPFGGHRRLVALAFVGLLVATVADNVRVFRSNQLNHPPKLRLLRHDGFTLERAMDARADDDSEADE
jgi:hypothetical protein